ncbi:MAG: histidinol dehydrogenase [Calditrichaeota bacterium]|nr:histidinol dehydrogenase [Calditrichota bacterium]
MKRMTITELNVLRQVKHADQQIIESVTEIIDTVRSGGDTALRRYNSRFDQFSDEKFWLTAKQIAAIAKNVSTELEEAIDQAYANISNFHQPQKLQDYSVETIPGLICNYKYLPIERVGLYIPGGSAPLFSSLLMSAIPAQIAGNPVKVVCMPANKSGSIDPATAYALQKCEIDRLYLVGGAQAIAAMAYGTKSVPQVDKIFGPGNIYVTTAKQLLRERGQVEIDLAAGPSEVLIIADGSADADIVAEDLLAQLEHGPDSLALLISSSEQLINQVDSRIKYRIKNHPRAAILHNSSSQLYALKSSTQKAVTISNDFGPEHLLLNCKDAEELIPFIRNAGSVFVGSLSAEALGDYASGPNHTLPTMGFARMASGLSVGDFMKSISFQKVSEKGLNKLGPLVIQMAEAEQLPSHAESIRLRLKSEEK